MERRRTLLLLCLPRIARGFTLVEVVLAVAVLCAVAAAGSLSLAHGLQHQETRGAAQTWQAEVAWTQVGVLWHGGSARAAYAGGGMSIAHSANLFGGSFGAVAPATSTDSNVTRWTRPDGVSLAFSGVLASPDGGGSVFFRSSGLGYRVVVRPETGLTVRSWAGEE
jgi:prepilin-type N-terminal cleavage/methylation domain-containing protein